MRNSYSKYEVLKKNKCYPNFSAINQYFLEHNFLCMSFLGWWKHHEVITEKENIWFGFLWIFIIKNVYICWQKIAAHEKIPKLSFSLTWRDILFFFKPKLTEMHKFPYLWSSSTKVCGKSRIILPKIFFCRKSTFTWKNNPPCRVILFLFVIFPNKNWKLVRRTVNLWYLPEDSGITERKKKKVVCLEKDKT